MNIIEKYLTEGERALLQRISYAGRGDLRDCLNAIERLCGELDRLQMDNLLRVDKENAAALRLRIRELEAENERLKKELKSNAHGGGGY